MTDPLVAVFGQAAIDEWKRVSGPVCGESPETPGLPAASNGKGNPPLSEAHPSRQRSGLGLEILSDRELRAIRHHWRRHRSRRLAKERLLAIEGELARRTEARPLKEQP